MNYSELTDPELCMAVAKKWLPEKQHKFLHFRTCRHEGNYVKYLGSKYDPTNNPTDAWPIILENEISLDPRRTIKRLPWMAAGGCNQVYWCDKNPLRAAMICFLSMDEC